jgi:hypothetical protein
MIQEGFLIEIGLKYLIGYLKKKISKNGISKFPIAIKSDFENLSKWVKKIFVKEAVDEDTIKKFEQNPYDLKLQCKIEEKLKEYLKNDKNAKLKLEKLIKKIEETAKNEKIDINIKNSGAIAFGNFKMKGKYVAGHDMNFK